MMPRTDRIEAAGLELRVARGRAAIAGDDPAKLAENDEQALAAALLDSLDHRPADVAALVARLPAGALSASDSGAIVEAIAEAVRGGAVPTIGDVAARLRGAGHGDGSPVRLALVEAVRDVVNTGRRALDTARGAVERIARRHAERTAAAAAERFAASPDPVTRDELAAALTGLDVNRSRRMPTALDALDGWARHERTPTVATGLPWFDDATEGGLPVGLTVLAAPPGRGKSALALQLTVGALLNDRELRGLWAAGEMTLAGIGRRLVALGSGLVEGAEPVTMGEAGRRTPRARAAAVRIAEAIGDRLGFIEAPLTVETIDAAVATAGARLLVVDYLQLITVPDGGRDRVADLDRLVGRLRDMAIGRELAVVLVSSVANRSTAADHAGQIGRGTAEIGFAAELVYAAEREETPDGRPVIGPDDTVAVTWRCAKSRNGEPRDLVTRFDGAAQTFYGPDDHAAALPAALGTVPLDAWKAPEAAT